MSSAFQLHERLAADTTVVTDLTLCRVLLMEDARYPWLILVPRVENLRELHEIPTASRIHLFDEIEAASRCLENVSQAYKLNVAALGNQVPQLHIHVIARQQDDPAWPGPVWGVGEAQPYSSNARALLTQNINTELQKALT